MSDHPITIGFHVTRNPVSGAKKVDGVKRHVLVDSAGVLVAAVVTAADMQGRAAFPTLLRQAKRIAPTIAYVWVHKGYTGTTVAEAAAKAGISVAIVSGPKPSHGFTVQPRRGVVERTNGWITTVTASTTTTKSPFTHTKASST